MPLAISKLSRSRSSDGILLYSKDNLDREDDYDPHVLTVVLGPAEVFWIIFYGVIINKLQDFSWGLAILILLTDWYRIIWFGTQLGFIRYDPNSIIYFGFQR